jgi:glycosyltransferase involved in cell wall biosynthesis
MDPRVSVVVPTYNRAAQLRPVLESVLAQEVGDDVSFEILVVDNGSTDETAAVVAELAARSSVPLRYCLEPMKGVAQARNRGIRETTSPWIAFIDDDELADRRWLGELLASATERGGLCVGGRVALALEDVGATKLGPFSRGLLGETPRGETAGRYRGKLLPGTGNVLIHRRVLEAVGGFDEHLVHGAEDAELFRRAREAGFELWYTPGARIDHRVPAYRLSQKYLKWAASRHGANYAILDFKRRGRGRVARDGLLRTAQALVVIAPGLLRALVLRQEGARVDHVCLLARAAGYTRQALQLLAPRLFSQASFFEHLQFRSERARFS